MLAASLTAEKSDTIPSGIVEEGERKRSAVEVSKAVAPFRVTAVNPMRADRLVRIADRDRNLNGRIEHLAPVRQRFMRVAPHVKLLRRAADVDRDRLERELRFVRRLRFDESHDRRDIGALDSLTLAEQIIILNK
jgi:hypothetical protein